MTDINEAMEIIGALLEYIDAIPEEAAAVFPVMPGIDRDYVNSFVEDAKLNNIIGPGL